MPTNRGQKYNSNLIFLSFIFFLVSFGVVAELWRLTYSHQRVLGLMAQTKDDSSVGSGKEPLPTPFQEAPIPATGAVIQPEPTESVSRPPEEVAPPGEPILIPIKDLPSQTINVVDPNVELALRNESQKLSISVVTLAPTQQTSPFTASPILFPNATPAPQAPGTSNPVTEEPSSSPVVNDPIYGSSSTVPVTETSTSSQPNEGIAQKTSDTLLSFFGINSDNADTTTIRATPKPVEGVVLADSSGEIVNNVLNNYKLSVSAAGTESVAIRRAGIAAVTSLPVTLSVNNISFKATLASGEQHQVTYYADSIVDTLITQHFISRVKPAKNRNLISSVGTNQLVRLTESNGELVYDMMTESRQYLFLVIPINVETRYFVSAEKKQIRLRTQSRLNQIFDMLSLEI